MSDQTYRYKMNGLIHKVVSWFEDLSLDKTMQDLCVAEEYGEVSECIRKGKGEEKTSMEMGDLMVTCIGRAYLRNQPTSYWTHRGLRWSAFSVDAGLPTHWKIINTMCAELGIDPYDCLWLAYEKISQREVVVIDGTAIKKEDLK